jgi:hypothetical protein
LELRLDIHELRLDIELLLLTVGVLVFFGTFMGMGFDGMGSFGSLTLSEPAGFFAGGGCCGSGDCGFAGDVTLLVLVGDGGPSFGRLPFFSSSFGVDSGAEEALIASPFVP